MSCIDRVKNLCDRVGVKDLPLPLNGTMVPISVPVWFRTISVQYPLLFVLFFSGLIFGVLSVSPVQSLRRKTLGPETPSRQHTKGGSL